MLFVHQNKQLCIGCGVCSGICPSHAITMTEDTFGFYVARVNGQKCISCGLCKRICPMLCDTFDKNEFNKEHWYPYNNNVDLNYTYETGSFIKCYEGFIENDRSNRASGGLCTGFLKQLLDKHAVDAVYCAAPNYSNKKLYRYVSVKNSDDIQKYSKSVYYPIELSSTITEILTNSDRVAIVTLPCQAYALRQAMTINKKLHERIIYIVGLICGGLPGKALVEFIARSKGVSFEQINRITFREKAKGKQCNNYRFACYCNDDLLFDSYFHKDVFGFAYQSRIFHSQACDVCDDIFAESADITFGDAWLDEYKKNELGTSICLIRNPELFSYISNEWNIRPINVQRCIKAQNNVGLIVKKKVRSVFSSYEFRRKGFNCPIFPRNCNIKKLLYSKIYHLYSERGKSLWKKYKSGKLSFYKMNKKLHRIVKFKKMILK